MSQYNKLTEEEIKVWKNAIDLALEKLNNDGWDPKNNSKKFDVLYKGNRIPPKEVIAYVFEYLNTNAITTSISSVNGGDKDTNELLRDFGLVVVEKKISLKELLKKIDVWNTWRNNYQNFVPQFIEAAAKGLNYTEWEKDVFYEFFEKSNDQCVSSLQQGYYTHKEKDSLKENWREIAPILKKISQSQNEPLFELYNTLKQVIRKYTTQDRRAATNRLIASIQPNILCTIVNHDNLNSLITYLNKFVQNADIIIKSDWFENSNAVQRFFIKEGSFDDPYEMITYPWQLFEYFRENHHLKDNDMIEQKIGNEILDLLKYKKQIILQGPPGTGKTREAKKIAEELVGNNSKVSDLKQYFKVGQKINSTSGIAAHYNVLEVHANKITIKNEKAVENREISLEIINDTISQIKTGKVDKTRVNYAYESALSIYLMQEVKSNDQIKLIQFHPSYTYEDFVRGIVSKPNEDGDGILYEAENKTLGLFAKRALVNYLDSKGYSVDKSDFQMRFNILVDQINAIINSGNTFKFGEKSTAEIISVGNNHFIYSFPERKEIRYKLLFNDIEKVYNKKEEIKIPIDLRDKEKEIELFMKGKYPYYFMILKLMEKIDLPENSKFNGREIKEKPFVLIIDEINRANLSSVLGELIYALEYRGEEVESMYEVEGSQKLILPPNLYIIGTMNTADRSVGHIDYAIRRRFAFVDVLPEKLQETDKIYFNDNGFEAVSKLFTVDIVSNEFDVKDVQIGHSYFIVKKKDAPNNFSKNSLFKIKMDYEIKPILREYLKDGIFMDGKKIDGKDIKTYIEDLA